MRTLRVPAYVEPSGRRLRTSSRRKPTRVTPSPSTSITLDTWIGASVVMMPPVVPPRPPCWMTLVCFLTRLTPSTTTRCSSRSTWITLPSAPLSLPAITLTVSPFLIFIACFPISEHLRCERDDLHEPLVTQLAAHGAEDARAARLAVLPQDDRGVLVELDVGPVRTTTLLGGAHDDGLDDVTLLHVAAGNGVLDRADDDVADAGVPTPGAAEDPDAQDLPRTGVVGDLESRLLLDHLARSTTCTTRQRLVADRGRVSMIWTRSPTPQSLASSWALRRDVRRMTLPYSACFTRSSTSTTTVLSILSLTTRPSRTLRVLRVAAAAFSLMRQRPPSGPLRSRSRRGRSGCRAHARAPRCRSGRCPSSPCGADHGSPAGRWPPGSAG